MHQSQMHPKNMFLTLTIAPGTTAPKNFQETPPPENTLSRAHHQRFMKRLRRCADQKLAYYMCGEYGAQLGRPHFHYLIFGYEFSDKKFHKTSSSGEKLYTSETLNRLWPYGHAWIGDVTYESCAYVAAYVMKRSPAHRPTGTTDARTKPDRTTGQSPNSQK